MPLIDTTPLLKIADRAAFQYEQLKLVLGAISTVGTGLYQTTVTQTDDPDVEIPTLDVYVQTDNDFQPGSVVREGTRLSNIVWGMEAHFDRRGPTGEPLQAGGWDGYLTSEDVRVSQYFGELFFGVKGFYMVANNVFSEGNDEFAMIQVAAGPSVVFTDGVNYGNGNPLNPANGTFFAATQLQILVLSLGGANLDIRLSVKDKNDNPMTIDVTVPGGSAPGTFIPVGTSTDRFLDVIGAAFKPAGSSGTVGDDIRLWNLKERQIQL